jgi:hypothetical protein
MGGGVDQWVEDCWHKKPSRLRCLLQQRRNLRNDRFSWRTFAKTPRQVSADSVAKVFLRHLTQLVRAVGAAIE